MDIPSVDLNPDDVLIVHVGVGKMPRPNADKYITDLTVKLKAVFGEDQPMITLAVSDVTHVEFSVIHRPVKIKKRTITSR